MTHSLVLSKAAENDITAAFLWYECERGGLGIIFEKQISKAIESISDNPLKIQIRYNNVRVSFLKKFPYGIHYIVVANKILIIAVFHTSQNSDKWPV